MFPRLRARLAETCLHSDIIPWTIGEVRVCTTAAKRLQDWDLHLKDDSVSERDTYSPLTHLCRTES